MRRNNIADGTHGRSTRQPWDENDQYRQPSGDSMQRNYAQRSQQDYSQRSQQQDDQDYNNDYRSNSRNAGNEYNDSMWREPQRGQGRQQDNYNDWHQEDRYNDYNSNRTSDRRGGYRSNEQDNDWNQNNYSNQGNYNQGNYRNDWNGGRYDQQANSGNRGSRGNDYERNMNYGQTNYGNSQGNMGGNNSGNYGSERYGSTGYAGQQRSGNYGNDWNSGRYGQQSQQQDQGLHRGKGPKGYQRSGERIREDISDRLSDDGMLDATDIEVKIEGNDVILSGTVSSREAKRRAEEIAESVSGVSNVENRIKLQYSSDTSGASQTSGTTAGSATMKASDTNASDATGADKNKNKTS